MQSKVYSCWNIRKKTKLGKEAHGIPFNMRSLSNWCQCQDCSCLSGLDARMAPWNVKIRITNLLPRQSVLFQWVVYLFRGKELEMHLSKYILQILHMVWYNLICLMFVKNLFYCKLILHQQIFQCCFGGIWLTHCGLMTWFSMLHIVASCFNGTQPLPGFGWLITRENFRNLTKWYFDCYKSKIMYDRFLMPQWVNTLAYHGTI